MGQELQHAGVLCVREALAGKLTFLVSWTSRLGHVPPDYEQVPGVGTGDLSWTRADGPFL